MFKIKSILPGLTENVAADRIRPWHLSALLLSLTTHALLILFIDSQITVVREKKHDEPVRDYAMHIRLVPSEAGNSAQDIKPTPIDDLTQTISKPRHSPPPPPEPIAEDPSPIFEILTPPVPHYFRGNALSEKPRVSLDIPPNLGASLSSDALGSAIFRLQINEHGEIDQIIVDESNFSEHDQHIVVDAFRKIKFEPGKIDGKVVKSELRIEVRSEKTAPVNDP